MLGIVREFAGDVFGGDPRPGMIQDRVIERLQRGRTLAALGTTVWLVASYPLAEGRAEFALGKLMDVAAAFGILSAAGLTAVTAFIAAARPPLRRVYIRRLKTPGHTLRVIVTGGGACAGTALLLPRLLRGELIPWEEIDSYGILATGAACLLFLFLLLVCVVMAGMGALSALGAAWYSLSSCFRLGDVHELLPALVSPTLVWALFVMNCLDGPDVAAPPLVLYTFLLGGPLSVTALSVWEIRRLRHRYGVTMRSALGRDTTPQPTYAP